MPPPRRIGSVNPLCIHEKTDLPKQNFYAMNTALSCEGRKERAVRGRPGRGRTAQCLRQYPQNAKQKPAGSKTIGTLRAFVCFRRAGGCSIRRIKPYVCMQYTRRVFFCKSRKFYELDNLCLYRGSGTPALMPVPFISLPSPECTPDISSSPRRRRRRAQGAR